MQSVIAFACFVAVAISQDCADQHTQCGQWASSGECTSNPFFMKVQCQKACNSCGCTIRDAATCGGSAPSTGSSAGQSAQTHGGPVGAPTRPVGASNAQPIGHGSHGMGSPPAPPVAMSVNTPATTAATTTTAAAEETTTTKAASSEETTTEAASSEETTTQAASSEESIEAASSEEDTTTSTTTTAATTSAAASTAAPAKAANTGACSNTLGDADCCRWASSGECTSNPFYMKVQCAKACGSCGCTLRDAHTCPSTVDPTCGAAAVVTTTTAVATTAASAATTAAGATTAAAAAATTQSPATGNEDLLQYCAFWAFMGECTKNPKYMNDNCGSDCASGSSSGQTTGNAVTSAPTASSTATGNQSVHNTGSQGSAKTAGCVDKDELCAFWSSMGECSKNPTYMKSNCGQSCKTC